MRVFIVFKEDIFNSSCESVDKVFLDEQDAINYVFRTKFSGNSYYENQTIAENEKCALEHIHAYEVVGS